MTDELDPMDLSALDPERLPERWTARMESTRRAAAAVLTARARPVGPLEIVAGWARPILAAAAVLLLFVRVASGTFGPRTPPPVEEARRLALLTEVAVTQGQSPTGAELRAALDRRERP